MERNLESMSTGRAAASVPRSSAGIGVPAYVRRVIEEASVAEITRLRQSTRAFHPRTPVLIAVVKDEMAVLPELLEHYRGLGIERFALLDNGSTDASPEFLAAQPDVDLYLTRRPFQFKQGWVNALIARYGYDRWYLHVDADEHVVFDGAPERTLVDMIAFAEANGLRRVRGMLVDMYAPGPVLAAEPARGHLLRERFRLFDGDSYAETLCLERISRKGGPRRRKFARENDVFDPELSKYPLFHIREGEVVSSPHHIYPYRDNYFSDCFLAILHYKFTPGLIDKARRAAAEGNYWYGSLEYRRYLEVLARNRRLSLAYPGTRRYGGPADLVAAGLIAPIAWSGRRSFLQSVADWGRQLRAGTKVGI